MNIIIGILAGLLTSLGFGGGGVLIIYLTLFTSIPQHTAQGINLLFFIPSAILSLIIYSKDKLVKWRVAIPFAIFGVVGALVGVEISKIMDSSLLSKIFGGLLIIMGLKTLISKSKNKKNN